MRRRSAAFHRGQLPEQLAFAFAQVLREARGGFFISTSSVLVVSTCLVPRHVGQMRRGLTLLPPHSGQTSSS
jgi:hypothetical protein